MFFKYNLPVIAWAIFILILLGIPGDNLPEPIWGFKHLDKVAHFGLFFIFTLLLVFGLKKQYSYKNIRSYYTPWVITISIGYAFFTEGFQIMLSTGRNFELLDAVMDILGSGTSFAFYKIMKGKFVFLRF
jgi:VanZ family protein